MADRIPRQVLERLGAVPLFSECNKAELRGIARLGTELALPASSVLTRQGKRGYEFFLLLDGNVRVLVDDKSVARLSSGDFFGEMALLDHGPRRATVIADGPVRVLVLSAREFDSLLDSWPAIARKVLQSFVVRASTNATYLD